MREELQRVRRVSDMLCTAHAGLRDRMAMRSLFLDLSILALSSWITALAFVEPKLNLTLTPFGLKPEIWGGLLAVGTFFLTVLQLKTDWKACAEAHKRSLDIYSEVKREAGYLLAESTLEEVAVRRVLSRYDMASSITVSIPEAEFLSQERRHGIKVRLSKHLDKRPSSSIFLTKIKFWWRDNLWHDGDGDGDEA